ncbi:transposase [Flavobacterium sp. FBOR7N2.3]|uniref:Transposase n=1 Tax=Flavobacterium magnesitis TaxID=3138077 RepID=A0ABV4TMY2_9FLAO
MKSRKNNRIKGFDYSSNNIYFVTICVQNRECCFGYVGTGRDLSVQDSNENHHSNEIHPNENPENIISGVKMNLNLYGKIVEEQIIWLQEQYLYVDIHNYIIMPNHLHLILEIIKDDSVKIKSLSSLIGAFKTTSSKFIHKKGFENFAWQRSFHDHIIRNANAYDNIYAYIDLNPQKWYQDCFFEKN